MYESVHKYLTTNAVPTVSDNKTETMLPCH